MKINTDGQEISIAKLLRENRELKTLHKELIYLIDNAKRLFEFMDLTEEVDLEFWHRLMNFDNERLK